MISYEAIWCKCVEFGIQQKKEEFLTLLGMLPQNPKILEIGCYTGGSSVGFLEICKSMATITLQSFDELHRLKSMTGDKWNLIIGNSQDESIIKSVADERFDLIFIDGDHTESGSKADFLNYKNVLSKNGIIAFHDIVDSEDHRRQNCYVSNTWNSLKPHYGNKEIITEPLNWGGIGVLML